MFQFHAFIMRKVVNRYVVLSILMSECFVSEGTADLI